MMRQSIREKLAEIVAAFQLESARAFRFNGSVVKVEDSLSQQEPVHTDHAAEYIPLIWTLRQMLYSRCYARPFDAAAPASFPTIDPAAPDDAPFADQLVAANKSCPGWDPEWQVVGVGKSGEVQVQKGDWVRTAVPGEYVYAGGPGLRARVGDTVALQVLREAHDIQPGVYYVFGETLGDQADEFERLHIYFHLRPYGAPWLIHLLTSELNGYQVPFRFKCQQREKDYDRMDACVLYVAHRFFQITARVLGEAPAELTEALQEEVPLFSKPWRPGIGLAESPGPQLSFGLHRCQLVAAGMLDAWLSNEDTITARLSAIQARFEAENLDLDRPYLNPGSRDLFAVPEPITIEL